LGQGDIAGMNPVKAAGEALRSRAGSAFLADKPFGIHHIAKRRFFNFGIIR
jgi:hypothetical protein